MRPARPGLLTPAVIVAPAISFCLLIGGYVNLLTAAAITVVLIVGEHYLKAQDDD